MEIQQHDGAVVEVAGIPAGLRQARREGEGGARGLGAQPSLPPLYIGALGGAGPWRSHLKGGGGQRGGLAPQVRWGAPHPQGF